ncbi:Hydrogenase expression/synthesis HypA family [Elusimicrobium minutum Pei191]|uniref:Hydrogenase maturation factor HypA n=1 Tax=Elusimicrobium minutum (strain Pei191) TaxID=445932 RepID=B2KE76_ELUMP|nr:hydrogenase nickel incorporation protein HypA [Elusimicrobium minutum]ACC98822.1 Hydrogenase expression/synthesis HypA family [Elusimicrobium minutum Pei191]
MHEWALSDSIAKAALAIKNEQNLKEITSITVVLGEVQDIHAGVFKEIFDEVKLQHAGVEKAELKIETEKGFFKCNNCKTEFGFEREKLPHETAEDIHFVPETLRLYINCPKCKSSDFNIIKGRGLYIKEIEGDK